MKLMNLLAVLALISSSSFAVSTKKVEEKVKVESAAEATESVTEEVDNIAKEAQGVPTEAEETAADISESDTEEL